MTEQWQRSPFQHPEDLHKALRASIPRVRYILLEAIRVKRPREQEALFREWPELRDSASIGAVHGNDEVEVGQVSN